MDFEIIDNSEVVAVKRGRKSTAPQELVKALATLTSGKSIRLGGYKCDPKSKDFRNEKSSKGAVIRSAGKLAGVKVTIAWSPDGVPQVSVIGKLAK